MAEKSGKNKNQTILIADDNKQTVELLKKFFTKAKERKDLTWPATSLKHTMVMKLSKCWILLSLI